jgi:primosomal protein N' (replication factor Y)
MFAEVAVNRRVRGTFHYHIPVNLMDHIQPGHLVKVAFGTAHTTGIVVALHDSAPIPKTKPILERLDPDPVVTPVQLKLALWLARQTLSPLGLSLWLMLPPGLAKRGDVLYQLGDERTPGKTATQKRLLSLLQRRGPLRGRQLSHALPQVRWQTSMSYLVKQGIVKAEPVLDPPDVKPRTVRTARLAIPPDRIDAIAPRLGRESRRANVIEVLLATPDHRMSLSAVLMAVGCTESPITSLAATEDVLITPKESWVELALTPHHTRARLEAGDYARAPAQTSVLETLLAAGKAIPLKDLNTTAVNRLKSEGIVHRWVEPAIVELLLSHDEGHQRIIELRGGQPYLEILRFLASQPDEVSIKDIYAQTGTDLSRLQRLADDNLITLGESEVWRDPLAENAYTPTLAPPLTANQSHVWNPVRQYMDTVHWGEISSPPEMSGVFVLHGVTGSGKTEIYMRAVDHVMAQGRQVLMLVPEIALTPQTVRRFAARFPGRVAVVHSKLTVGERYDTWRRARTGEIQVIVGARSALFAPLPDIGLIILDEEHDDSYKQSPPIAPPYYHARETAIEMMRLTRGTVLLGSATPDVVTFFRAQRGDYQLLSLPDRVLAHREHLAERNQRLNAPTARYDPGDVNETVSTDLPTVTVVDMRQELRAGNRNIFSRALQTGLNEVLARGEQAILFLNRRGTATFIMCRDCGYIADCPRCNTPLTFHSPREALICHYCGYTREQLTICPDCGSHRIKHFGQGTELIESAVQKTFPTARTIRWDRDTVTARDAHDMILKRFSSGQADIMIGTQMIAKGLDLPHVTLVGIISADTALGLPDFRAGERTFQLLTQVAGRAGRSALGGRVILQSYLPEHYAIQAAAEHDYETFYHQEQAFRREQLYPPFRRLARILFQYPTPGQAQKEAERAAKILTRRIKEGRFTATEIIGPTPCFFAKRNNLFRWHLVLRSANPVDVLADLDFGDGWYVDIDPVDML